MNMRLLILLLLFGLGGALSPSVSPAEDYLLFGNLMWDSQCMVIHMDGEANLRLREVVPVTYNALTLGVSPDRRTVVVSGYTTPTLTVLSIRDDGSITPPVNHNGLAEGVSGNTLAFHPSLPLFYVTSQSGTATYRYDRPVSQVETVAPAKKIGAGRYGQMAWSAWAGRLFYASNIHIGYDAIESVALDANGLLGQPGDKFQLPTVTERAWALSPDGRWIVVAANENPQVMLAGVGLDGTPFLADTASYAPGEMENYFSLCFSPDSRYLYLVSGGRRLLTSYAIDAASGKLSEIACLRNEPTTGDNQFDIPQCLKITPDGRYLVFRAVYAGDFSHNLINVVRLSGDGQMTYLPDKAVEVPGYLNDLAIASQPHTAAGPQWALYE